MSYFIYYTIGTWTVQLKPLIFVIAYNNKAAKQVYEKLPQTMPAVAKVQAH